MLDSLEGAARGDCRYAFVVRRAKAVAGKAREERRDKKRDEEKRWTKDGEVTLEFSD